MTPASSIGSSPNIFQFRLATLLMATVWIGLALAALATPTRFWVAVMSTITLLSLITSVLVIIYRTECIRAFAVGFLVFGGSYGAFVMLQDAPRGKQGPGQETVLPTTHSIGWLYMQYHAKNTVPSPGGGMGMGGMPGGPPLAMPRYLYQYFYQAAQFVFTNLIGLLGGVLAKLLYLTRPGGHDDRSDGRQLAR